MKQADAAQSNDEANTSTIAAVALKVNHSSKLDLRIVQLDRTNKSLLQDMEEIGPNLKEIRLQAQQELDSLWRRSLAPPRHHEMPDFRFQRRAD